WWHHPPKWRDGMDPTLSARSCSLTPGGVAIAISRRVSMATMISTPLAPTTARGVRASTRTSPIGNPMSAKGYTLVELLTVLAVLALLTAITGTYLRGRDKPFALRIAALDLASCLRLARASAIAQNRERVVAIDLDRR